MVESIASSYTLTNTKLTGTGAGLHRQPQRHHGRLTDRRQCHQQYLHRQRLDRDRVAVRPGGHRHRDGRASGRFTLTNTLLTAPNMTLSLSGITTANLTDSSTGGNTFTVTGWTGSGTLKGATETVVDVVSSSVALANTSLAVTGWPTLTLSGFTTANLTDTAGGNTFTVSGWTGSGSLTDSAATPDTVAASKSASFTLTNTSLSSTDGMALALSGITTANLTATSCRQDVHRQRLDGDRVADRHGDGHRDGEQERRLHPDQHVAVVHRRHDARP